MMDSTAQPIHPSPHFLMSTLKPLIFLSSQEKNQRESSIKIGNRLNNLSFNGSNKRTSIEANPKVSRRSSHAINVA
jgi:hypothetical protein